MIRLDAEASRAAFRSNGQVKTTVGEATTDAARMFYLYHHNDLGRLAELFGALRQASMRAGPRSPLAIDTVLTPNPGVGRWLAIQLAESEGIAANIAFQLPGGYIWDLLRELVPDAPAGTHFEADCLPWHLYVALPAMGEQIPAVADYLGTPLDEVRRYQLARQLADVFDAYLVYRADMLARWEAGETPADNPGRWQAQVWRWLTDAGRLGRTHRARVLGDFVGQLRRDRDLQARVADYCPAQLYCFGLVALAPDHLRLLYALAEHVDVHFLLPNPSAEYWGEVTAGRLALDLPATEDDAALLPGEAAVEAGHPLLGALGRMARDTLRVLYSDEFAGMVEPELGELMAYEAPGEDSPAAPHPGRYRHAGLPPLRAGNGRRRYVAGNPRLPQSATRNPGVAGSAARPAGRRRQARGRRRNRRRRAAGAARYHRHVAGRGRLRAGHRGGIWRRAGGALFCRSGWPTARVRPRIRS